MSYKNVLLPALAAGVLACSAGMALAATAQDVMVSGSTDGTAAPGGTATTSFSITFAGSYEFIGMGLTMFYDPAFLSFNPAQSSISYGAVNYSLPAFATLLGNLAGTPGYEDFVASGGESPVGELFFNAGFLSSGSQTLTGTIVVRTAFDLLPALVAGMQTSVSVDNLTFADTVSGPKTLASPDAPFAMTITAVAPVPEPGHWLMMLAGLGLLGGVARRRSLGASAA